MSSVSRAGPKTARTRKKAASKTSTKKPAKSKKRVVHKASHKNRSSSRDEHDQAKWALEPLETRCLLLPGQGRERTALLACRVCYRPKNLAQILKQAAPTRFVLSFEISPQPDTSRQKLRVVDVLSPGQTPEVGSVDRAHLAKLVETAGAGVGTAAGTLLGGLVGAPWAGLPGAALGLSGLLAGAWLGKKPVDPAVPFVLRKRTFGFRYARTDDRAAPSGILEGGAVLRLDASIRYLSLEVRITTGARDVLRGPRIRVPVKAAPHSRAPEPSKAKKNR